MAEEQASPDSPDLSEPPDSFHDEFLLIRKIGCGRFSVVYTAQPLRFGAPEVVVKVTDLKSKAQAILGRFEYCEPQILRALGYKRHVPRLLDNWVEDGLAYLVMTKCSLTLLEVLEGIPGLCEATLKGVLAGMARGIVAVHSMGIAHCDVRLSKFMSYHRGEDILLTDFGDSHFLREAAGATLPVSPFSAPEVLKSYKVSLKADVWSYGICVYVLFFGCFPFTPRSSKADATIQAICSDLPPPFRPAEGDGCVSEQALGFVQSLLKRELAKRPTSSEVLGHGFLKMSNVDARLSPRSLEPTLRLAQKLGVFCCTTEVAETMTMDLRLAAAQQKRHGRSLERQKVIETLRASAMASDTSSSAISEFEDPSSDEEHEEWIDLWVPVDTTDVEDQNPASSSSEAAAPPGPPAPAAELVPGPPAVACDDGQRV